MKIRLTKDAGALHVELDVEGTEAECLAALRALGVPEDEARVVTETLSPTAETWAHDRQRPYDAREDVRTHRQEWDPLDDSPARQYRTQPGWGAWPPQLRPPGSHS